MQPLPFLTSHAPPLHTVPDVPLLNPPTRARQARTPQHAPDKPLLAMPFLTSHRVLAQVAPPLTDHAHPLHTPPDYPSRAESSRHLTARPTPSRDAPYLTAQHSPSRR